MTLLRPVTEFVIARVIYCIKINMNDANYKNVNGRRYDEAITK